MNRKTYFKYTFLCFLICSSIFSFAQSTPDPGIPGTYTVLKAEYNLGDLAYKCPHFPDSVEVRGSVHYPSALSAGPFPVIVFLHGRHSTCYQVSDTSNTSGDWPCLVGWQPITSYEGYDYLAANMASHGYIVISVSCNAINATDNSVFDYGMQGRAELVQRHLDLWNTWNTVGGGPFDSLFIGRLNMQNIGIMGHSRGGEGVVFNALYNQSLGSPYGIHAVLTLAPVDFERNVLHGIPLLNVAPYCDGDVVDLEGVHFYDDSRYTDTTDEAPKHSVLFMGANHDFFNTVWTPGSYIAGGFDDWSYDDFDPQCGTSAIPSNRFDTTTQKAALTAYASAFFRVYIGHETQFAPILNVDDIVPPASSMLDSSQVYVSFQPARENRLDLNRTDSIDRISVNTLGDSVTDTALFNTQVCSGGFSQPDCDVSFSSYQLPHDGSPSSAGLSEMGMQWSDTLAYYENSIPSAYHDLTVYQDLLFRTSVNFSEVSAGSGLDFTIQLIDSTGAESSLPVSAYSHALFYQPGTEYSLLPKLMFNTVKFPLSGFTGIDLSNVRKVKFLFNRSAAGSIFISDLAFSNAPCSGLNASFTDSIGSSWSYIAFINTTAANTIDSLTWHWSFGDTASGTQDTSTLPDPIHNYTLAGTYNTCLTVTDYRKNGFTCADTFCNTVVVINTTSVSSVSAQHIVIAPNPATDRLYITGAEATDIFTLVNLYGQIMLSTPLTHTTIHLPESIPTGIYYAIINTATGNVYNKILIKR